MDRSPTAELLYKDHSGLETKSAGIAFYANAPVSAELVEWADVILCMEDRHQAYIERFYPDQIAHKKIDTLDIEDDYGFMHSQLKNIIKTRVDAWLRENGFGQK
jgi:predicted protein tyrosine phosphatase